METHKQVMAKVNAPVDEGVLDLVSALSFFTKLQTHESCQGVGDTRSLWVAFYYGVDPLHSDELADFVLHHLGPMLNEKFGDLAFLDLHVAGISIVHASLTVRKGAEIRVVEAIRELAQVNPEPV